jgi:hypothetical protein
MLSTQENRLQEISQEWDLNSNELLKKQIKPFIHCYQILNIVFRNHFPMVVTGGSYSFISKYQNETTSKKN